MTKLDLVSIRKITFRAANIALSLAVLAGVLGVQSAHAQTFTVLYNFTGGTDGANPAAGLLRDAQGILYGSTGWGGAYGWGRIFKEYLRHNEAVVVGDNKWRIYRCFWERLI